MSDSDNTQINESAEGSDTPSTVDSHTGLDGTKHIGILQVKSRIPDPDVQLDQALYNDSFFPNTESYLIINGWPALEEIIDQDAEVVKKYNDHLTENQVDYQLRHKHEVNIRNVTYLYSGMYIFKKETVVVSPPKPDFLPPRGAAVDDSEYCGDCYKWINNKQWTRHVGSKVHDESVERQKLKPSKQSKLRYVERFDPHKWRTTLGDEVFKAVGVPPRLQLPTLKYRRVEYKDALTDCLIMPYSVFMQSNMAKIFQGYPIFRLS